MQILGDRPLAVLVLAAAACLLLAPGAAHGQAIGGTVTDTTGGVLPGVTVEARSPALIEQVRTAVTDGNGQYLIVALETGDYSVTFTLPGFSTVVREGVELSGGFTANVDVELPVGALEETVTVTQASPLIDVQSVEQRETMDREVYEVLPTARSYDAMALLVPAMNVQGGPTTSVSADTGGITGGGSNRISIHGSRDADAVVAIDGMDINQVAFDGSPAGGSTSDTPMAEFVYDYSGSSAEAFGGRMESWHGVDLNFNARVEGVLFQGGFATGKRTTEACAVNAALPERINQGAGGLTGGGDSVVPVEHCATETPWLHQASLFGSYTFPYDIVLSGTLFTRPGTPRLAVVPVPNAVAEAALGRPPTETSIAVNVIPPGSAYGDRLNQVDLRIAKVINTGGTSNLRASLDLYNVFNANAVARERYTLRNYLQPVGVQLGRLVKLTMQLNF